LDVTQKIRLEGMAMNRTRTLLLMAVLTALFLWAGHAFGGQGGLVLALGLAFIMNFGTYWLSDRIVLRMHGAEELPAHEAPGLHQIVRRLAMRADMPVPKIYIINEESPNAFATGRDPEHAAVAVTQGLLRVLDRAEIEGVLAHEIAHVRNRDTLVMAIAATLAGALSMLANMAMWTGMLGGNRNEGEGESEPGPFAGLLGVLVAPFAAMLIQMAISRSREFVADEYGARLSGNPAALARALKKIEAAAQRAPMETGSPTTAHIFIVNPFAGGGLAQLFSTHPSTETRVAKLMEMHRHALEKVQLSSSRLNPIST
jgi:heat shock protein HtpX